MAGLFIDPSLVPLHVQAILLTINSIIIVLIGPKEFLNTLHPRLQPFVLGMIALAALWSFGFPFFVDRSVAPPRWATGGSLVWIGAFLGFTFYVAKIRKPVVYGSLEILAGLCGLLLTAIYSPANSVLALSFGMATSIYIIVRGLTNINDALNSEPLPVAVSEPEPPKARPKRRKNRPADSERESRNSPEPVASSRDESL